MARRELERNASVEQARNERNSPVLFPSCFQRAVVETLQADPRLLASLDAEVPPAGLVWAAVQTAGADPVSIAEALARGGSIAERGDFLIRGPTTLLIRNGTPLHVAAALGRVMATSALLRAGADATALDMVSALLCALCHVRPICFHSPSPHREAIPRYTVPPPWVMLPWLAFLSLTLKLTSMLCAGGVASWCV